MKAGDAILTVGLVVVGLGALYWIYTQYQANQVTATANQNAAINIGELQQAASLVQSEQIIQQVTNTTGTTTAPVTTAPAAVNPTTTSSGQQ